MRRWTAALAFLLLVSWSLSSMAAESLSEQESQSFYEGLEAYQMGVWPKVVRKLKPFLKKDNPLPDYALFMVAVAERETGDCAKAAPRFVRLRKKYPASLFVANSYFEEARARLCNKQYEKARESIKQFRRTHPPDHLVEESKLLVGKSYYLAGDKKQAAALLSDFWRDTPESDLAVQAEDWLREMKTELGDADKWSRARRLYELRDWGATKDLLVQVGGQDSFLFAECVYRLQDYQRAKKLFETLVKRGEESNRALSRLATISEVLGDYEAAIKQNLRLARQAPGSRSQKSALKSVASLQRDQKKFAEAAQTLTGLLTSKLSYQEKNQTLEELAWTHYRSGQFAEALKLLGELEARKGIKKQDQAKYSFWKGKILAMQSQLKKEFKKEERKEKLKLTKEAFQAAWQSDRWGYYGLSALQELNPQQQSFLATLRTEDERRSRAIRKVAVEGEALTNGHFHLSRAEALHTLGLKRLATREMKAAYQEAKGSPALLRKTGEIASAVGNYYIPLVIGLKMPGITEKTEDVWRWIYPKAYAPIVESNAQRRGLDPRFVYALMRQESLFQEEVVSPVGARGLIQIMPFTGRRLARLMGWKGYRTQDLFEPTINIALSTLYLQMNSELFQRRLPLVAASYNAGEAAVERWLKSRPRLEDWEFIEEIPYRETNNYVKKVMANYWMYQYLYPESEASPEAT